MKHSVTNRGFSLYEFQDSDGHHGSLQESSISEGRVWLGINPPRMHIDQDTAKELIVLLQRFVDTGRLKPDDA